MIEYIGIVIYMKTPYYLLAPRDEDEEDEDEEEDEEDDEEGDDEEDW